MDEIIVQIGICAGVVIAFVGLCSIVYLIFRNDYIENTTDEYYKRTKHSSLLAVVGSGGHTSELLTLMQQLGDHYQPRYYVMAKTDRMSEEKVERLESNKQNKYEIYKIPRSREVKQSWISTIISTLYAILYSLPLVFKLRPAIILCNGPGTCIPICFAGILLKVLCRVKIIYVESICRVESLSLSGKILYHFVDSMIVQWPQLHQKYPKTVYMGRIV